MNNIQLLIIDDQYDFCNPNGSLYVPGAEKDCERLAQFIDTNSDKLSAIHATMDAHMPYHIAHPLFWKDENGNHPGVYTIISSKDIEQKKYAPVDSAQNEYAKYYVDELEKKGKYQLCIWPPHCLLGSEGQAMDKTVFEALNRWQEKHIGKLVNYVTKAKAPMTEQYSAIQAEVPIKGDDSTTCNVKLIKELEQADKIIVAGQALSHCVANTVRDLFNYIPASKIVLLTDCASSVAGFESNGEAFTNELISKGGSTLTSKAKL